MTDEDIEVGPWVEHPNFLVQTALVRVGRASRSARYRYEDGVLGSHDERRAYLIAKCIAWLKTCTPGAYLAPFTIDEARALPDG